MTSMTTTQPYDYRVDLPEGELDGLKISRFEVSPSESLMSYVREPSRDVPEGVYTKLTLNGRLWMTDTPAEWHDHRPVVRMIQRSSTERVLINGLGIGMVLKAALACDHIKHVDVVEIDPRVVTLVGSHYETDPRVKIHNADAYEIQWPPGTQWDVAWHDIWPDLCVDNLPLMARLHRRYGRRAQWQGSWGRELLIAQRARDRRHHWSW